MQVLQEKGRLRLRIVPEPRDGQSVVFSEEGEHLIRVFPLDDHLKKIGAILGPKGLAVPVAVREQVLETVAQVAPLLTVQSIVGGPGQAESVPADSRPVLRMYPIGAGLNMELFLRPIPNSPLLVRPGESGQTLFADMEGRQVCTTRGEPAEQASVSSLLERCPTLDPDAGCPGAWTTWKAPWRRCWPCRIWATPWSWNGPKANGCPSRRKPARADRQSRCSQP